MGKLIVRFSINIKDDDQNQFNSLYGLCLLIAPWFFIIHCILFIIHCILFIIPCYSQSQQFTLHSKQEGVDHNGPAALT